MKTEDAIRMLAGALVLLSVALAHWASCWWLLVTVFVGLNLVQSAFTGFCPAEVVLHRVGITAPRDHSGTPGTDR